jgi:hypothetical protein
LIAGTLAIFNNSEMIPHLPHDHISELIHSCLQWTSHENISLSNGASQFISNLALLNVEYCDQVVQGIMSQNLDNQLLDTTIKMRYLGMISEILATGKEEWFASCLRYGATDAILKAPSPTPVCPFLFDSLNFLLRWLHWNIFPQLCLVSLALII